MTTKQKSSKKRTMSLGKIIILGLCLKLLLGAGYLLLLNPSPDIFLTTSPAYAQDEEAAAPANEDEKDPAAEDNQEEEKAAAAQQQSRRDSLAAYEQSLREKEERLKQKEEALDLLKEELTARMAEIEVTRNKLEELVKKQEALVEEQKILRNARIEHLVTAYKGMRPEAAGTLVNSLDDEVAVNILAAMPGRSAGQILAYVDPEKAARLTKAISRKQNGLPPEQPAEAEAEAAGGQ